VEQQQIVIEALKIAVPAGIGFAAASVRRLWTYRRNMRNLLEKNTSAIENLIKLNEQWGSQFRILFIVQNKQIKAQRATLEVVSQQVNNGNVKAAFKALNEAEQHMQDYAGDGWGCPPTG
jgi:hypothetical protein